jgi:hypothetical protein
LPGLADVRQRSLTTRPGSYLARWLSAINLENSGMELNGAREIHAAAEQLAGEPLLWTSVKAALAAGMAGKSPRFRRVRRGVYQTAESVSARRVPLL